MESTPKTSFERESKDLVLPGLEKYNWMVDVGLSTWVQEFFSNDRTWFISGQAHIWWMKLGEGKGVLEVETEEDYLERTFFS